MTFDEICAQMREKLDALAEGDYQAGFGLINLTDQLSSDRELCEQYFGKAGETLATDDLANMLVMIIGHACKDYSEDKRLALEEHMKDMVSAIYTAPPLYTDAQLAALLPGVKQDNLFSYSQFCLANLTTAFADMARVVEMGKIAEEANKKTEMAHATTWPNTFNKGNIENFFTANKSALTLLREEDRAGYQTRLDQVFETKQMKMQAGERLTPETQKKLSYSALAMPQLYNYFRAQENNPTIDTSARSEASECARFLGNIDLDVDDRMRQFEERIKNKPHLYRIILKNDKISEPIATSLIAHTIALEELRAPLQKLVSYYEAHHNPHKKKWRNFSYDC